MNSKSLEIANRLVWLAFAIFTCALFISDFKHTHTYENERGVVQHLFANYDYQLKFLAYLFVFIPLLIFTFLRHNLFSKLLFITLIVLFFGAYYKLSFAFEQDGYLFYSRSDYAGYYPYTGFYLAIGCGAILLFATILKLLAPIVRPNENMIDLIDDF